MIIIVHRDAGYHYPSSGERPVPGYPCFNARSCPVLCPCTAIDACSAREESYSCCNVHTFVGGCAPEVWLLLCCLLDDLAGRAGHGCCGRPGVGPGCGSTSGEASQGILASHKLLVELLGCWSLSPSACPCCCKRRGAGPTRCQTLLANRRTVAEGGLLALRCLALASCPGEICCGP